MKSKILRHRLWPLAVSALLTAGLYVAINAEMDRRAEAVARCMAVAPSERVGLLYCPGDPWAMIELWDED